MAYFQAKYIVSYVAYTRRQTVAPAISSPPCSFPKENLKSPGAILTISTEGEVV